MDSETVDGETVDGETAIVAGAGIVGLCAAFALQRQGIPTVLIDPGAERPAASWGNAGHVAIEQVAPLASLDTLLSAPRRLTVAGGALALPLRDIGAWAPFVLRLARAARPARFAAGKAALSALLSQAMPAWRQLAADLRRPDLLIERGHMVVWQDRRRARRGAAAWQAADIGQARCRPATAEELNRVTAVLRGPLAGGLTFENTGQVLDPGGVLAAVTEAFLAAGGTCLRQAVTGIAVTAGRAELRTDGGRSLGAGRILIAAGVGSGALLRPLGLTVPIIAERGYHIQSADHQWPAGLPPVVFEERSMIVSRFASGVRAASFVELSRHEAPPTAAHWDRLERHVRELGLPLAAPFSRWHGSRPTLPDYLPAIGRTRAASNLYYAFGHQHLGLTLAPVTARLLLDLLTTGTPGPSLAAFSLDRFR